MRRILALLVLATAVLIPGTATARPSPPSSITVLRLGDSRTIGIGSSWGTGYAPELQRLLGQAGIAVSYAPIAGSTGWDVQNLRSIVDSAIAASHPDLIVLAVGTNNAANAGVPPHGMTGIEAAYSDLVRRILADAPAAKLVIAEIQYSSAGWAPNEVHVNVAAIHASWLTQCAGRCWLSNLQGISRCGYLGGDNIHPSDAGYQVMADQLARTVLEAYGLPVWPSKVPEWAPRPGFEVPAVQANNGC